MGQEGTGAPWAAEYRGGMGWGQQGLFCRRQEVQSLNGDGSCEVTGEGQAEGGLGCSTVS